MDFGNMSDKAILSEIGLRVSRQRLNRDITQIDLARRAGVARMVVQRLESGRGCTVENLIRVMRTFGLLDQLDAFLPETGLSPLQLAKSRGRQRLHAFSKRQGRKHEEG
jgi:transcriptional regulator with XRE-family HTH domain